MPTTEASRLADPVNVALSVDGDEFMWPLLKGAREFESQKRGYFMVRGVVTTPVFLYYKVAERLSLLILASSIVKLYGSACPGVCVLQLERNKTICQ